MPLIDTTVSILVSTLKLPASNDVKLSQTDIPKIQWNAGKAEAHMDVVVKVPSEASEGPAYITYGVLYQSALRLVISQNLNVFPLAFFCDQN